MSDEAAVEMQTSFDEFLTLSGDPTRPVLAGMLMGNAVHLKAFDLSGGESGGKATPPFYDVDAATREVRATAPGILSRKENKILFTPIVSVSSDSLSVRADIYATDFMGEPIKPIIYERAVRDLQIGLAIDLVQLAEALKQSAEEDTPRIGLEICAGRAPKHGQNGRIERLLADRDDVGTEGQDGTIDFRNRGAHPYVTENTPIARYHPPTNGVAGLDVYGNELTAKDGEPRAVEPGENVKETLESNGTILYTSTTKGLVEIQGDKVDVSTLLHIDGDVDMNSGNLTIETGSVHIHGTIRSGFSVQVADHLKVDGAIESALVTCGGDIEVQGGVAMEGRNLVKAGGSLHAGFAQDAVLEADGDVIIGGGIINSFITCRGKILADSGKGVVQGGSLVAARGMEIKEVGSEIGVQTALTIALEIPELDSLLREQDTIRHNLSRLSQWMGEGTARTVLLQTPEEDRLIVAEMLRVKVRLEDRLKEVANELKRISALNNHALARASIAVSRTAHAGTRLKFGEKTQVLKAPASATRFIWNPEDRAIESHSLV